MRFWVAAAALAMAILAQTPIRPAQDLERGKRIWGVLCVQCHGVDGDLLGYDDIVPIAGIGRRYPPDVIGALSGKFSGRVLYGQDRSAIVDYMSSLRGGKGFPDPGWLVTPYLLERKAPRIHEFRILDTRDKDVYRLGHAANAVSVEPGACLSSEEDTAQWLGRLGVSPTTVVLVYDEIGGPSAACAWWRIRRAGHKWVAVVDGGWRRWTAEGRFTTTAIPKIESTIYRVAESTAATPTPGSLTILKLGINGWNWKSALDRNGFREDDELARLAKNAGLQPGTAFRVEGPDRELGHLALTLELLGYELIYDSRTSVLSLSSR
jgi:hypothetical protein